MKNKRLFALVLVLVLVFSFILAACEEKEKEEEETWGEWTMVTAPTIDNVGKLEKTSNLGNTDSFELPKLTDEKYIKDVLLEPKCEEEGETQYSILVLDKEYIFTIKTNPIGHKWSVSYAFSNDGKTCLATRTCENDAAHNILASGVVTSEVSKKPTFETTGQITYTATFEEEWATTQIKVVETAKYELNKVERVEPTVNSEGNILYYAGTDGKYYDDENRSNEITLESTILPKLTIEKVEKVEAQYGENGVKEYYVDAAGNKYTLVDEKYVKVEDEAELVISEVLGNVKVFVNGELQTNSIKHKKSELVTLKAFEDIIKAAKVETYAKYSIYTENGYTNEITFDELVELASNKANVEVYVAKYYNITFNPNGGSWENESNVIPVRWNSVYGDYEKPVKTGYDLVAWTTQVNGGDKVTLEDQVDFTKTTLYAQYKIRTNTITFDTLGGSEVASITAEYGAAVTAPIANPTKLDNTFQGWCLDSDGKQAYTFTTMPAESITIYAKWKLNYDEGLVFREIEGGLSVRDYRGEAAILEIPAQAQGKDVIAIGGAFTGNRDVKKIIMPNIKKIGYEAFARSYIEEVVLGENDVVLESSAFAYCSKLKTITNQESITNLAGSDFNGCEALTSITLPKISKAGNYSFKDCTLLDTVNMPLLTDIGWGSFENCTSLASLNIGEVTIINEGAFKGAIVKDSITFDKTKVSIGGVIFENATIQQLNVDTQTIENITRDKRPMAYANIQRLNIALDNLVTLVNLGGSYDEVTIMAKQGETELAANSIKINNREVKRLFIPDNFVSAASGTVSGDEGMNIYLPFTSIPEGYAADWVKEWDNIYLINETERNAAPVGIRGFWYIDAEGKKIFNDNNVVNIELINPTEYKVVGFRGEGQEVIVPERYNSIAITTIGAETFSGNETITSADLSHVVNIENKAFFKCINLRTVILGEGLKTIGDSAFEKCGLESVNVPSTLETIREFAFRDNVNLGTVTLADGLKAVGDFMFYNCKKITAITFPNSLETIGQGALDGTNISSIIIPKNTTLVGASAFSDCKKLESVIFEGNKVTEIGNAAFQRTILSSCIIPEGVTTLGDIIFEGVTTLTTLLLPSTIQPGAEQHSNNFIGNASNLREIYFTGKPVYGTLEMYFFDKYKIHMYSEEKPTGISTVAGYADFWKYDGDQKVLWAEDYLTFYYDKAQENSKADVRGYKGQAVNIVIPQVFEGHEVTSISNNLLVKNSKTLVSFDLGGKIGNIDDYFFDGCTELTTVTGFDEVTYILDYTFRNCGKLQSISLPKVTTIGESAFEHCVALTTVSAPLLDTVRQFAFFDCQKLENINFEQITRIESNAFYDCNALTNIKMIKIESIGASAFESCNGLQTVHIAKDVEGDNLLTSIGPSIFSGVHINEVIWEKGINHVNLTSEAFENFRINKLKTTDDIFSIFANCTSCDTIELIGDKLRQSNIVFIKGNTKIYLSSSIVTADIAAINNSVEASIYLESTMVPEGFAQGWNDSTAPVYLYSENKPGEPAPEGVTGYWHYVDSIITNW